MTNPAPLGPTSRCGGYALVRRLAQGGMGEVWLGQHVTLGHHVAIKVLAPADQASAPRFRREALVCARLADNSPHVVRVIDYGIERIGDSDYPFLVMELLSGETLAQRLHREGKLEPSQLFEIVRQLCDALRVTHAAGVVHRDLKPSNVFLCQSPTSPAPLVKLLDFGIAKASASDLGEGLTQTGTVLGTPGFISPEQVKGESELDGRADLWALAAIVYRALTGARPFGSGSFEEVTARILWGEIAPPSSHAPELPQAVDRWMGHALARHREDRFPDTTAFLAELERALRGEEAEREAPEPRQPGSEKGDGRARPARRDVDEVSLVSTTVPIVGKPETRTVSRIVLVGSVVLALAAGSWLAWHLRSPELPSAEVAVPAASATPVVSLAAPAEPASSPPAVVGSPVAAAAASDSPASAPARSAVTRPRAEPQPKKGAKRDEAARRSGWNATGEL